VPSRFAPAPAARRPRRTRDAERSREAILDAAESLFAERGFEGASLAEIGERAGVSRATPSYFFGAKEDLYAAVIARTYEARNAALGPAFARLTAWARADAPAEPLADVLGATVEDYLRFLHDRPGYVAIIEREALAGGERLAAAPAQSTVMEDAFGTLRRRARAHGLKRFDVAEAIIALVALAFMPVAHRDTLLRRHALDPGDPRFIARRRDHIVGVLVHLMGAD